MYGCIFVLKLLLFVSICLHHQTFCEMLRYEERQLDRRHQQRNDAIRLNKRSISMYRLSSEFKMNNFIWKLFLYVNKQRWVNPYCQSVSGRKKPCNISFAGKACFHQFKLVTKHSIFFQQMRHPDFQVLIICIGIPVVVVATVLLVHCHIGKMATESFTNFMKKWCFYERNCTSLTIKLQKFIIISITNTQRPICYHGFNMNIYVYDWSLIFLKKNYFNE